MLFDFIVLSSMLLCSYLVSGHKYSVEYCANYLCSEYVEETSAYLSNRCAGDFADIFAEKATEVYVESISSVSLSTLTILAITMFIISFSIGLFVSKYYPLGREEPI
jgi:hypothetical protein